MIQSLILKIRRRETPFYDRLFRIAKWMRTFRIPVIRPIHGTLYYLHLTIRSLWNSFWRVFYYEPLFRTRCRKVGERLMLFGGIPVIDGNLQITLGDDCDVYGKSTFASTRVYDEPELIVGNQTHLGYGLTISVGQRVEIGNHVLISGGCFLADNDGHPYDYKARRKETHQPVTKEQIQPIKIEDDCWIGSQCIILKGVTLGQGSIVGSNSLVSKSVPPFCIVGGVPAKIIKELPIPDELAHLRERRERELGRLT